MIITITFTIIIIAYSTGFLSFYSYTHLSSSPSPSIITIIRYILLTSDTLQDVIEDVAKDRECMNALGAHLEKLDCLASIVKGLYRIVSKQGRHSNYRDFYGSLEDLMCSEEGRKCDDILLKPAGVGYRYESHDTTSNPNPNLNPISKSSSTAADTGGERPSSSIKAIFNTDDKGPPSVSSNTRTTSEEWEHVINEVTDDGFDDFDNDSLTPTTNLVKSSTTAASEEDKDFNEGGTQDANQGANSGGFDDFGTSDDNNPRFDGFDDFGMSTNDGSAFTGAVNQGGDTSFDSFEASSTTNVTSNNHAFEDDGFATMAESSANADDADMDSMFVASNATTTSNDPAVSTDSSPSPGKGKKKRRSSGNKARREVPPVPIQESHGTSGGGLNDSADMMEMNDVDVVDKTSTHQQSAKDRLRNKMASMRKNKQ